VPPPAQSGGGDSGFGRPFSPQPGQVGQTLGGEPNESACATDPAELEWRLDRTVNVVDGATLLATIALALAAVWYFEPKHSRRTASFEVLNDALAAATAGVAEIELWTIREQPATRLECDQLVVSFRAVANALWLIEKFAAQRGCRPRVRSLVADLSKNRQTLYDHLTGVGFPADQFMLGAEQRLRANSMIGLFRKSALELRAELVSEL
jgi:hypothetical protein